MDRLIQDLRFPLRSVVGNPFVRIAAVVSLALGIGAGAACRPAPRIEGAIE